MLKQIAYFYCVVWLVHRSGPDWDILTNMEQAALKCDTKVHGPWMN